MEMVLMPADQLRTMMIEAASIAVRHNQPAPATVHSDDVLSIEQAAEFLLLTPQTVYGLVSDRKIPFCKPTKSRLYFLRSDLIQWLKAHRTATAAEQVDQYEQSRPLRRNRATSNRKAA